MKSGKLSKPISMRQENLLHWLEKRGKASNKEVLEYIQKTFHHGSRVTIVRDLNELIGLGFVKKIGAGRAVRYLPIIPALLRLFDPTTYFQKETDQREIMGIRIDFRKYLPWKNICSDTELKSLSRRTLDFNKRLKSYTPQQFKKELERITIEFSWKSSHMEGNTYSLLDTEMLIKNHQEAQGHPSSEAVMILNHKTALEYVWQQKKIFKKLKRTTIEDVHALIIKDLGVSRGLRKRAVGITGTKYKPIDNPYQIREMLEELCTLINAIHDPFEKAIMAVVGIAYLQPFEDGNKRSSRLIGNAILLAYDCCPLSYRSILDEEYKKAIILFYEQHSLRYFKQLFLEQAQFALEQYFL